MKRRIRRAMEEAALKTATVVPPDEVASPNRNHRADTRPPNSTPRPRPPRVPEFPYGTILLLGIMLPIFTLTIELFTQMCAEVFFDPLPTALHVFLVALVPISNIATLTLADQTTKHRRWLGYLNAAAIGVGIMYSVAFAPLMPMSFMALIIVGMGLLSLTPALSLIALLVARRHLRHVPGTGGDLPSVWKPLSITAAILLITPLHSFLTFQALDAAALGSPLGKQIGLWALRTAGSRDALLEACYRNNG
ncbi:MAG: hypothetical protein ACO1QR_09760, partial [Chthoniobacteraceae bacterium]